MLLDFLLFSVAFASGLTVLTLVSKVSFMESLFFRVLTGGSVGAFTSEWLTGLTPTLSFYEATLNGDFGFGGYACFISTLILLGVWIYNLFTYRGKVIV
jgi:hypothetical protein